MKSHTAPVPVSTLPALPKGLAQRPVASAAILSLCLGLSASATEFSWLGAANGNWSNALNWSGGTSPASAADTAVIFGAAGPATTTNDLPGGLTLNSLTLGADSGARTLAGGTLTFAGTAPALTMLGASGDTFITTDLVVGSTLTVTGGPTFAGQLLLAGDISGAGALHFGDGISLLSGTNTYTGATTVGAGALLGVAAGGLAATSGVTVEAGGQLQIVRQSATTATVVNRPLSLAGALITSSPTITDPIFGGVFGSAFWSGAITLGGDAMIGAGGGSELTAEVSLGVSGSINLNGHDLTLRVGGFNNEVRITGAISGDGDVRVLDTVGGGIVSLSSLSGNGRLIVERPGFLDPVTVTGNITGNRDIEVKSGMLALSGTGNTFTGNLVADAAFGDLSILSVSSTTQLGDAANTVTLRNGGSLRITSSETIARAIHLDKGGSLIGPSSGFTARTYTGDITGTGGLVVSSGVYTFTGNNSFTGGLHISSTSVNYTTDSNLGAAGEKIVLVGGQLNLPSGLATFDRPIELQGNSSVGPIGFFVPADAGPLTISGGISGPGRLEISGRLGQEIALTGNITGEGERRLRGRATYTLSGENTFSGRLTVLGASGTPTTLIAASAANLGGANSPMTLGTSATTRVVLRATGDIDFAATRTTAFSNLTVDTNGHDVTFNQAMSGSGITKDGEGVLTFGGLTDSGGVTHTVVVNAGTLRLGVDQALGSRASVRLQGSTTVFDLAGHDYTGSLSADFSGSRILLGAGTLTLRSGYIAADISGTGGLVLTGTPGNSSINSVELAGNNTFTGGIRVEHLARLVIGAVNPLTTPGNSVIIDGGGLRVSGEALQPVVIGAATPLTIGPGGATFHSSSGFGGQSIVIERQLTGSAPLQFLGGSDLDSSTRHEVRLAHANNTFTGPIALGDADQTGDAIIGIVANGSLGDATNTVTLGDRHDNGEGIRTATGGLRAYAHLTLPATRAIRLSGDSWEGGGGVIDTNGFDFVIDGAISQLDGQVAPLVKTGAGTLVLNGANTFTGRTRVLEGTLGGHGSLAGRLSLENATFAPGQSAGLFTVAGNLDAQSATFDFELGGTVRGDDYDALNVGGSFQLSGGNNVLLLSFIDGFEADIFSTDTFNLITASSLSGAFSNIAHGERLFTDDGFGSFVVNYGAGSAFGAGNVVLSDYVSAIPEPGSYAMLAGAGVLAVVVKLRRRRPGSQSA